MADQLHPIPLVTPGFQGLNTAQASVPDLDPAWAIVCQNFVFDQVGRLTSRQGWTQLTAAPLSFAVTLTGAPAAGATSGTLTAGWAQATGAVSVTFSDGEVYQGTVMAASTTINWNTPLTGSPTTAITVRPAIGSMAELALANGSVFTISAMNNQLYSGTTTLTNVTGSLTITGNNWQWHSFNGALYGIQAGHPLITWNGVGNATLVVAATAKSFTGSIAGNTLTVTAISSGTLGTSDPLTGAGITAGTQIVAQTSGTTGGIGTYLLNNSMTVASEAMTVVAGTVPSGGSCGVAAFGRLWVMSSDNQTLNYCALLDATTWNGVGAGSINFATVWTRGIDQVVNVAAAGSKLVIFGTKQILLYADSAGATIGLNPTNLYVYDTIEGTGLAARDTVQATGEGDLTFYSPTGVQSLQRLLASGKDNPVASLDRQVHDYMNAYFLAEVAANVKSAYSPNNRFYVILLPASQIAFCYDTRIKLQDGSLRVTQWGPGLTWSSLINTKSGNIYFGENGKVGQYGGYLDNTATYQIVYNSPHTALRNSADQQTSFENHAKIMKREKAVIYASGAATLVFSWGVDFKGLLQSYAYTLSGNLSEYGIAQYGINEYGGGAGLSIITFPLSLTGRWVQFGLTATINGGQIAIQQLDAFVKIGNTV